MDRLKLIAFDQTDLEIVSAHVQDAVLRAGDIHYAPRERRLLLAMNRFDWAGAVRAGGGNGHNGRNGGFERRRAVLHFEGVRSVKCRDLPREDKDRVLNVLAVTFDEVSCPGGFVDVHFSGGGVLRVEVECIEARLCDLDGVWSTEKCPAHSVLDEPTAAAETLSAVGARP